MNQADSPTRSIGSINQTDSEVEDDLTRMKRRNSTEKSIFAEEGMEEDAEEEEKEMEMENGDRSKRASARASTEERRDKRVEEQALSDSSDIDDGQPSSSWNDKRVSTIQRFPLSCHTLLTERIDILHGMN